MAAGPKGNRLVFVTELPTQESNTKRMIATPWGWQLGPMYESLIGVDADNGKRIPQLAKSWKLEPDGMSWRFQLKKGVQFHKGYGEFTAKDLPHAIDEARKTGSHAGIFGFWTTVADKAEVVGDYEVVYKLKQPDSTFLDYVGEQVGGMDVHSKKHLDEVGDSNLQGQPPVGTGPYQYRERTQGSNIIYDRVHGGAAGRRGAHRHAAHRPDGAGAEAKLQGGHR